MKELIVTEAMAAKQEMIKKFFAETGRVGTPSNVIDGWKLRQGSYLTMNGQGIEFLSGPGGRHCDLRIYKADGTVQDTKMETGRILYAIAAGWATVYYAK